MREFLADTLTPLAVYRRLRDLSPRRFLFESVTGGEQVSRFSFLGVAPREIYRLYPDRLERQNGESEPVALEGAPLDALHRVLCGVRFDPTASVASGSSPISLENVPLTGGWVGYFGYDLIRLVERLPNRPADPFELPIAALARYDSVLVFDHAHQRILAIANEIEGETDEAEARAELDRLAGALSSVAESGAVPMAIEAPAPAPTAAPSLSDEDYAAAVTRAKHYIEAGDIFQVVLARRWQVEQEIEPMALYRALRVVNPSPYMVMLEAPEATIVGASPEMLVRRQGDRLETRPIAGTRPRGETAERDRALAEELMADPKERAEHVMLVDLGRNDLGRVACPGGVRVASFMEVERYSHVMHISSSVEAEQAEGGDALDALLACFPAGTLSGAPKIRAMEIIDELEPESRGVYGGAIGYLSFSGDMDTCIAIRTLVSANGQTSVTAGAGIVADSDPECEVQETRDKAAALLHAVALAARLEEKAGES